MRGVRKIAALVCAMLATIYIVSCSTDVREEVDALMQTVPADCSSVAVLNLDSLHQRLADQDIKAFIADNPTLGVLFKPDNGLKMRVAVVYTLGSNRVLTMHIDNTDKLRKAFGSDIQWQDQNGISTSQENGIILTDKQMWICSSSAALNNVNSIIRIDPKHSYAKVVPFYEQLLPLDCDASMVVNIDAALKALPQTTLLPGISVGTLASTCIGLLGQDIKYVSASFHTNGNQAIMQGAMYNSQGKKPETPLQLSTIDTALLRKYINADCSVLAIGIDSQLTDKLSSLVDRFARFVPGLDSSGSMISKLKGTAAFGYSSDGYETEMCGVLSCTTEADAFETSAYLNHLLGFMGNNTYRPEGNLICFNSLGSDSAKIDNEVLHLFDNATIAYYAPGAADSNLDYMAVSMHKDLVLSGKIQAKRGKTLLSLL